MNSRASVRCPARNKRGPGCYVVEIQLLQEIELAVYRLLNAVPKDGPAGRGWGATWRGIDTRISTIKCAAQGVCTQGHARHLTTEQHAGAGKQPHEATWAPAPYGVRPACRCGLLCATSYGRCRHMERDAAAEEAIRSALRWLCCRWSALAAWASAAGATRVRRVRRSVPHITMVNGSAIGVLGGTIA